MLISFNFVKNKLDFKKITTISSVMLSTLTLPTMSIACLPLPAKSALIGRVQHTQPIVADKVNTAQAPWISNSATNKIIISSMEFPFRDMCLFNCPPKPKFFYNNFAVDVDSNSLIVALVDNPNGQYPQDYQIETMALLSCNNDKISIGKPIKPYHGWNKKTNNCSYDATQNNGIFDGFMTGDQASYIEQLQKKYPTCASLEKSFPKNEVLATSITDTPPKPSTDFWNWLRSLFNR